MTTYYVKNGGSNAANGLSDATAWETVAYAFSQVAGSASAHIVLLKCGDTFTKYGNTGDTWNARGTAENNLAVLGAYYMDAGTETRGVSGAKPILDGDFRGNWEASISSGVVNSVWAPQHGFVNGRWYRVITAGTFGTTPPAWPLTENATVVSGTAVLEAHDVGVGDANYRYRTGGGRIAVSAADCDYFRFENLKIGHHRGRALDFNVPNTANGGIAYHEIYNCDLVETGDVLLFNGQYENVDIEWIHDSNYFYHGGCGSRDGRGSASRPRPAYLWYRGKLSSTGVTLTRRLTNNIASRNWQEFINASQKVFVADNIWHAFQAGFYNHSGYNTTAYGCRYNEYTRNILLGTTDPSEHHTNRITAIAFDSEFATFQGSYNNIIHNNLIAFCGAAFSVAIDKGVRTFDNSDFVYNTCIDNTQQVSFFGSNLITGARIKNNIFWNYTQGLSPYTGPAQVGVDCDYNCWNSSTFAGNLAGANDVYSDPLLYKSSGWSSILEYTEVNATDFRPLTGSPVLAQGTPLTAAFTYDVGYGFDYNGTARSGTTPSIGAWETAQGSPGGGGGGDPLVVSQYTADTTTTGYIPTTGDNLTIPKPLNTAVGNLILFNDHSNDSFDSSSTSNFNDVETSDGLDDFTIIDYSKGSGGTGRPEAGAYYRIADGSEGSTFEYDALAVFHRCVALRVDGFDPADPIGPTSKDDSEGTGVSTITAPGVTTTVDGSMVFILVSLRNSTVTNLACNNSALTAYDYVDGASRKACFYKSIPTAGATGDFVITWTTTTRAAVQLYTVNAGTADVDISAPVWTTVPYASDVTDTDIEITAELTDDSAPVDVFAVATSIRYPAPTTTQVIAGDDGNGLNAMDSDSDTNVSSATEFTLDLTPITEPKVRVSVVARDDEGNTQLVPVHLIVTMDAPTGFVYQEVTIDSGAAGDSVLFGLSYRSGDVIVYPTTTTPDGLTLAIDGEGDITITRGGNTDNQTFDAYLWSQDSGSQTSITYSDPFYQTAIGRFKNNTGTIVSTTIYVKFVPDTLDQNGVGQLLSFMPYSPLKDPLAQAVVLDANGDGTLYHTETGTFKIIALNSDGSFIGMQEVTIA